MADALGVAVGSDVGGCSDDDALLDGEEEVRLGRIVSSMNGEAGGMAPLTPSNVYSSDEDLFEAAGYNGGNETSRTRDYAKSTRHISLFSRVASVIDAVLLVCILDDLHNSWVGEVLAPHNLNNTLRSLLVAVGTLLARLFYYSKSCLRPSG